MLRNIDRLVFSNVTEGIDITNSAATGDLVITGDVVVGATLTATPDGFDDLDGLTPPTAIAYAWQRGNDDDGWVTVVSGPANTFTLTVAEQGLEVRAIATFTDDLGVLESITSDPTLVVAPAP